VCLILLAWRAHPEYPLVVAANRDEFFVRRTLSAQFWREAPQVLAGRDLEAGGTWMGITRSGRFAALTNYRDPARLAPHAPSRGALVARFLAKGDSAEAFAELLEFDGDEYNGFNILFGELGGADGLHYYSNCGDAPRVLAPGVYGLSNHLLDTPWPKVAQGKSALERALAALPDEGALFELLRDDRLHPDAALPRTGVSLEWERLLSAAFVRSPDYGTRSSTVLIVDRSGSASFVEQTFLPGAEPGERVRYRFDVAARVAAQ
jgi:uncharacterized protein with NRDE domain